MKLLVEYLLSKNKKNTHSLSDDYYIVTVPYTIFNEIFNEFKDVHISSPYRGNGWFVLKKEYAKKLKRNNQVIIFEIPAIYTDFKELKKSIESGKTKVFSTFTPIK